MSKEINEESMTIELKVKRARDKDTQELLPVTIDANVEYRVESEGVAQVRRIRPELTTGQKTSIKTFANSMLQHTKTTEEII